MKCFDRALNITPDDYELWYRKGVILDKDSETEAAIECYDKAISFNSDMIDAWYNKGVDLERIGNVSGSSDMLRVCSYFRA